MLALNSGHTVGKIGHPEQIRAFSHEPTVHPILRCFGFAAAGGSDTFPACHPTYLQGFHQTLNGTSGSTDAFTF
jgi:hypothetical protein